MSFTLYFFAAIKAAMENVKGEMWSKSKGVYNNKRKAHGHVFHIIQSSHGSIFFSCETAKVAEPLIVNYLVYWCIESASKSIDLFSLVYYYGNIAALPALHYFSENHKTENEGIKKLGKCRYCRKCGQGKKVS